jgi:phosphohistidine phosphatase SixA
MAPKTILVMRHAEKPDDPYNPDLSKAGMERAARLAQYIPDQFGTPDFVIAAAVSPHSMRPYQTVVPLAKEQQILIDSRIASSDYSYLAHRLINKSKYKGSLILLCWHHGQIPPLLDALTVPEGSYPSPWDKHVFNLIIELKFRDGEFHKAKEIAEPF